MNFNADEIFETGEIALELGKEPKEVATRIVTKSYLKATIAAAAMPTALCFSLSNTPVLTMPADLSEIRNVHLAPSMAGSDPVSSSSGIVLTSTGDRGN